LARTPPALPPREIASGLTGPLTIGEAGKHLRRAQSVVSEIVDHLEKKHLLERLRDPRDRRRTLVWLTEDGLALLERDREVLSRDLLTQAAARMTAADRAALLRGTRALLAATEPRQPTPTPTSTRSPKRGNR
jgi:DNA-binding MarR family transcriptional regulator